MVTKSDPGDDSEHDSGYESAPPGNHRPTNSGPGTGRISVDTDSLHRSARRFDGAGDNFHSFGRDQQRLINYEPLVNGESDDSWDQYKPSYTAATQVFVDGVSGLAKAIGQMSASLRQFAEYCTATEDNAEYLGKNALNMNGTPDPADVPNPSGGRDRR